MVNVAICCNNEYVIKIIEEKITAAYRDSCLMSKYYSYSDFVDIFNKEVFDIVFLDMDNEYREALNVAETIRKVDRSLKLVFISKESNYVFSAFNYNMFWFLRLDSLKTDVDKMVKCLKKEMLDTPQTITFFTKNGRVYINQQDIVYIEVMSHDTTVHTKTSTYNTNRPLDKLIKDLDPFGFIRIHNAFLVNYRYIASIHKYNVILNDSTELPISKKRKKDVSNRLKILMKLK